MPISMLLAHTKLRIWLLAQSFIPKMLRILRLFWNLLNKRKRELLSDRVVTNTVESHQEISAQLSLTWPISIAFQKEERTCLMSNQDWDLKTSLKICRDVATQFLMGNAHLYALEVMVRLEGMETYWEALVLMVIISKDLRLLLLMEIFTML